MGKAKQKPRATRGWAVLAKDRILQDYLTCSYGPDLLDIGHSVLLVYEDKKDCMAARDQINAQGHIKTVVRRVLVTVI